VTDRVLVIAAHPDDEVLGCGGVMARHSTRGDIVDVAFMADGVSSRPEGDDTLSRRRNAAKAAAEILQVRMPRFFDYPDNRLDSVPLLNIAQSVEQLITQTKPTLIYTHHGGDLNVDHRIVHQAVVTALRPMPDSGFIGLFAFEVLSSTEWATPAIGDAFRPDRFVDISTTIGRKIEALKAYAEEMRPFPHARSYEAAQTLATMRGVTAGLRTAEAFVTLKWIER
jgi:LmbE family N-acetylglucosaminyl deacetylase